MTAEVDRRALAELERGRGWIAASMVRELELSRLELVTVRRRRRELELEERRARIAEWATVIGTVAACVAVAWWLR